MSSRVQPFVNQEVYHVFNRGVAKMPIFLSSLNYQRFLKTMQYYQIAGPKIRFSLFDPNKSFLNSDHKIVEVICYCLMPNHFHILLQQKKDGGVSEFVSKVSNSYTKYFNIKQDRVGPVLQGEFKATHIDDEDLLLHVSRYIHLNPMVAYKAKSLDTYPWSSYFEYIGKMEAGFCTKSLVLNHFSSIGQYKQFLLDQVDYAKSLEYIKLSLIDFEK